MKKKRNFKSIFEVELVRAEYLVENSGFSTNMSFYKTGLKYASITDVEGVLHQFCEKDGNFNYYVGEKTHNFEKTRTKTPYVKLEDFKSILPNNIYNFLGSNK
jgi:hypothetical protein